MSVLLLLGLGAASTAGLWGIQSLLLFLAGEPQAGPLRARNPPARVRWPMKIALQLALFVILLGYPLALGRSPLLYHRDRLVPAEPWALFEALVAMLLCFLVGTGLEVSCGWVQWRPRYGAGKTLRKAGQAFLTPFPLALLEEGIFRGIVLDAFLLGLPATLWGRGTAVVASAAIFAAVHFIRPAKTYGQAGGLFVLGCLLGSAYLLGDRTYWLPVGLHAGGILAIQLLRPFVEYRGPPWLVGYRSYPIAGLIGILAMGLLGLYLTVRFAPA
jgi:hypothetical protein